MMFLNLLQNIALLIALSVVHSMIMRRWRKDAATSQVFSGMLFGAVCVVGMATPVRLLPGIIFDGRSIVLGIAGLFGGPIAAAIAAVIAAAYRIWLGGAGAIMGVSVITESAALGVAYHYLRRRRPRWVRPPHLLCFGMLIHIFMVLLMVTLPHSASAVAMRQLSLPVLTIYPAGVVLMCLLFLDQESRRRAEEALQASAREWQTTFDAVGNAVWLLDDARRIVRCNAATARIFGVPPSEVVGRVCSEVVHETSEPISDCPMVRTQTTHQRESMDLRLGDRWLEVVIDPILRPDGTLSGAVHIVTDITERKRAEEELARYHSHLEELVEARTRELEATREQARRAERLASLGTLAGGIAHEINNPVGGILLAAQSALAIGNLSARQTAELQHIVRNADRCKVIVQNIRQFARAETMEKTPGDINAAVRSAADLTQKHLAERGCAFELSLGEGLPPVRINAVAMEQVLVNLIRNAADSKPSCVRVRTRATPDAVEVAVEDDGRGIPKEHLPHLFDPFFTTRQAEGGMGLGLSIVHGIIGDHGGTIAVAGGPERGTTFTIRLPLASTSGT